MKCEICQKKIETNFLEKIFGTVIKDSAGKKHYVCSDCQHQMANDKKKMLAKIKG